jgi:hypothetical protein
MFGLKANNVFFSDYVFFRPIDALACPIWRCRFVTSTVSESNNPIVPIPAPAK